MDFPDPVKRDGDHRPFQGMQIKGEAVPWLEVELPQGDPDYLCLDVIEIANLEGALPEVLVPADPAEKLVDGYHGFATGWRIRRVSPAAPPAY